MFGVFSLWIQGMMTYLIPRILKTEWYSRELCEWHFWLASGGIVLMSADLILGGLFQGAFWAALYPWESSVQVMYPFWVVRVWAGLAMFGSVLVFLYNIYKTWQNSQSALTAAAVA